MYIPRRRTRPRRDPPRSSGARSPGARGTDSRTETAPAAPFDTSKTTNSKYVICIMYIYTYICTYVHIYIYIYMIAAPAARPAAAPTRAPWPRRGPRAPPAARAGIRKGDPTIRLTFSRILSRFIKQFSGHLKVACFLQSPLFGAPRAAQASPPRAWSRWPRRPPRRTCMRNLLSWLRLGWLEIA